jgi:membrane-associated phospholipid phosphatase
MPITGYSKPNGILMKSIPKHIISLLPALLLLWGCSKSISDRSQAFPALNPAKTDLNAGTWKPILLNAPDEFAVPAPGAPAGPDYTAQINEIKSSQASMDSREHEALQYWSAGAVLRWNEITRELVAKYNLPPVNNPDGTYPVPDANNPLAYPYFPFSNPPYAARAYAYISAACYDALVACYHYKKLYNRAAPYNVSNTVTALVPKTDLPSYPSEDATVAGVMWEMMKLLFPGEQAFVQEKVNEHLQARIASGANVRSDLDAGFALGRSVALKFVARARTDRAGQAGGSAAIEAQFRQDAIARGEAPWLSQEFPARPGMLMLFGRVRTWNFDSTTLISIRPPAPPSTSSQQFKNELAEVYEYARNPTREQIRIAQFWADGVGTYTPPGHWNAIACEDFVQRNFSEVRWARNLALLNTAMMDGAIACWDAKYFYFNPRPFQMDNRIKTVVGLPNFPSYTSGHSTFSGAAATVLGFILKDKAESYQAMAREASISRLYGAIHYRSDCEQGLICGQRVGGFAIERGKTDGAGE